MCEIISWEILVIELGIYSQTNWSFMGTYFPFSQNLIVYEL